MKLSEVLKDRLIPLTHIHQDLYMKDLPAKEYEYISKLMTDTDGDDETRMQEFFVKIFNDIICDKDGNAFEDLAGKTYDEMLEALPLKFMWEIAAELPKTLLPGNSLGN